MHISWFSDFLDIEHTLHRNTHLSTLRLCGVFCTTANIRTLKRTVYTIQRFAVSQKNCTKAITISPFSLPLPYIVGNWWFSTLRCTKTGNTQPKLNVVCFVVQSCLTDADFVIPSNYCLISTREKTAVFTVPFLLSVKAFLNRRFCCLAMRRKRHNCRSSLYTCLFCGAWL